MMCPAIDALPPAAIAPAAPASENTIVCVKLRVLLLLGRILQSTKPAGTEWRNVDRGRAAGDEISDDPAGHRRRGHPDMAVAEGIDDIGARARRPEHRQRIGQRRAMSHPHREALV